MAYIIKQWTDLGKPAAVMFCQLDYRKWMEAKLPEGISVDHFGNTAGTNKYENVALGFIVGRTLPGPQAVESGASTLSGLQVESIIGDDPHRFYWYGSGVDKIEMRDGSTVAGRGHRHPDKLANAMVRSILSELLQAFGRPRPWGRDDTKPLNIFLLLDEKVPGVIVDVAKTWSDPFKGQIAEGIMLKSEVDLMKLWPQTFTSAPTARRYIKKMKVPDGWRRFRYRLEGQRGGRVKAGWFDPERINAPEDWLEERLDGKLAAYVED